MSVNNSRTIAVYLRVSTAGQKTDSQRPDLNRWIQNNGIDQSRVRWFEDKESGKTLNRPAFDDLRKAIFDGEIGTVVVWKLDRLSRRLRDGIELLSDWCERGVRVVAVTQQIDLSGAVGRMLATVLFGLAEIEMEFRSERQAAGIAVARERGVYLGRKPGSTRARPARAAELQAKGLKVAEIGQALGVSKRTVMRYLASTRPGVSADAP